MRIRSLVTAFFLALVLAVPTLRGQINIVFDYTYDSGSFFSGANADRRNVLEAAAATYESRISLNSQMIAPSGGNTWSWVFDDPTTNAGVTISNPTANAGELRVFVGAQNYSGSTLAFGGSVGRSASGTGAWLSTLSSTNTASQYLPYAGVMSFDTSTSWFFDSDVSTDTVPSGQSDAFSVVIHELGHILGIGASNVLAWTSNTSAGQFVGAAASALFGGGIPLQTNESHFANGTRYQGQELAMDPSIAAGTRKRFTELEYAVLDDLGYGVSEPTATPTPTPAPTTTATPTPTPSASGSTGSTASSGASGAGSQTPSGTPTEIAAAYFAQAQSAYDAFSASGQTGLAWYYYYTGSALGWYYTYIESNPTAAITSYYYSNGLGIFNYYYSVGSPATAYYYLYSNLALSDAGIGYVPGYYVQTANALQAFYFVSNPPLANYYYYLNLSYAAYYAGDMASYSAYSNLAAAAL